MPRSDRWQWCSCVKDLPLGSIDAEDAIAKGKGYALYPCTVCNGEGIIPRVAAAKYLLSPEAVNIYARRYLRILFGPKVAEKVEAESNRLLDQQMLEAQPRIVGPAVRFDPDNFATITVDTTEADAAPDCAITLEPRRCSLCHQPIVNGWCRCT